MSRPTVSKAQTSYPIFGATFANSKPSYLVVGGGGGGGRHGVKNKITVFDFSSRAPTVEPIAEIEASQDDSVTCLANLATKDGLILYAGINGSEEERLKDKNEHFQAFEVQFPRNRRASNANQESAPQGKISFLSKTTLFTPPATVPGKKDGYQRLLRLSPPLRVSTNTPNKRIGAIASSLAGDENEVVVFSATSNKPQNPGDIVQRIALHKGQEANDLDILDRGEGRFQAVYTTDHDVYVQDIHYDFAKKKTLGKEDARKKLYTLPFPDVLEKKGRPKFRCLRWLSPSHILLVANKPNRTGVELLVLRLYEEDPGSIIARKTLAKHVKAAVDMDVALLDSDSDGAYQLVVAVASIDVSLALYTLDYSGTSRNSLSRFHHVDTYHNVHDVQMTKVIFSPFIKPETSPGKKTPTQYLRLASTSLGNTISVETFELQTISPKPKARYILQSGRSRVVNEWAKYIIFAVIALSMALMIQSLIDPAGELTKGIVPESLHNAASLIKPPGAAGDIRLAGSNPVPDSVKVPVAKASQRIRDLLQEHDEEDDKAIVVHDDPATDASLSTEIHPDTGEVVKRHTEAKKWDELSHEERNKWRRKLTDAGVWAVEEGETILKKIFFSEAANLVGHLAHGVIG